MTYFINGDFELIARLFFGQTYCLYSAKRLLPKCISVRGSLHLSRIKTSFAFFIAIAFQLLSFNSLAGVPSRDFSVYEEQALGVYLSFFGRAADPAGLAYWASELERRGGGALSIIDSFAESAEYQQRFGHLSNPLLITNLYQQLFGRNPDTDGLNYWVGQLDSGELRLQDISVGIFEGAQGDDLATVNNRLSFSKYYVTNIEQEIIEPLDADSLAGFIQSVNSARPSLQSANAQLESQERTVTLVWSIPTTRANDDALSLTEIGGYTIYYFEEAGDPEEGEVIEIPVLSNGEYVTEYTTPELAPGTYYFAISAYDSDRKHSDLSEPITAVID